MKLEATAWVEVDLEAIRHNYREVQRFVGPDVAVMAVIKTNAYGHGLELVARALRDEAPWFGVSTVEEGIRARAAAPETPILVFQPCGPWNAALLVANNLTATVDSEEGAKALAEAGRAAGRVPEGHVKLDTGMGRFGFQGTPGAAVLRRADINITGVFTHLATAGEPGHASAAQLAGFDKVLAAGQNERSHPVTAHALNSAGALRFPSAARQMVRIGTLLYGQYPSRNVPRPLDLKPTWSYKTRIVSVRRIAKGQTVGYGAEWTAKRESVIATIPVGYYDGLTVEPLSVWRRQGGVKGFLKRLRGQNRVNIRTARGPAPIVGRVAAQSAMLDVTDLPGAAVGDIVEVPARRVMVGEHIPRVPVHHVDLSAKTAVNVDMTARLD
jgi:alanine racemase